MNNKVARASAEVIRRCRESTSSVLFIFSPWCRVLKGTTDKLQLTSATRQYTDVTLCHSFLVFGPRTLVLALLFRLHHHLYGEQTAAAYPIRSVASDPEDVHASVFDMAIDSSPVHFQQSRCVWDSQKWKMILAAWAPDFLAREDGVVHV